MIPGKTSLKFPFPWHFVISLPVPGKRKFWPGIKTGNTIIICSFADGWSRHENKSNLEFNLAFYMVPRISRDSQDSESEISNPIPVAFSNSRSLPVKRECDFPFPGAKKPFPLTSGLEWDSYPHHVIHRCLVKDAPFHIHGIS